MGRPDATLAITLGAASWPNASQLSAPASFAASYAGFVQYLVEDFELPRSNLLDLFDSPDPASVMAEQIYQFLCARVTHLPAASADLPTLIVYYVGHGDFAGSDYLLAVKRTSLDLRGTTSLRMRDLAEAVRNGAPNIRRYLILDCCFAAAAYAEFQSGPVSAAAQRVKREFPSTGTALLCASGARDFALAPENDRLTMFTGALLDVLQSGSEMAPSLLSLRDVGTLVEAVIRKRHDNKAVRPQLHTPEQIEGDISLIPLFPNRAVRASNRNVAASPASTLPSVNLLVESIDAERRRLIDSRDEASLRKLAAQFFGQKRWPEALYAYRRLVQLNISVPRAMADSYEQIARIYWRTAHHLDAQRTWALCLKTYDDYFPTERAALAARITTEQDYLL